MYIATLTDIETCILCRFGSYVESKLYTQCFRACTLEDY